MATVLTHEADRLATLHRYQLLDTPPEEVFDDLTTLAAHICEAPIALITLIDEKRQWFKSAVGMGRREIARDICFCESTLTQREVVIVADALNDERFAGNPLVTAEPHVRFYAGVPLVTPDGHALGTLCVFDRVPRTLRPHQQQALRVLSHHVAAQFELRRLKADIDLRVQERTAALQASEERFRELADTISEVFWVTDPRNDTMLYVSPAYEPIWGRSRASLYQSPKSWFEAVHPEDRDQIRETVATNKGSGSHDQVYRIVRPDGAVRWIHDRAFPVRNERGEVIRVVGIAGDITERTQAEQAVRDNEQLLSESQRIAHLGSWSRNAVTGEIRWSDETFRIFGMTRDNFVPGAETLLARIHPDDQPAMREWIRACKSGEHPEGLEYRVVLPDGQVRTLSGRGDMHGVTRMVGTVQDITERKDAQQALEYSLTRQRTLSHRLVDVLDTEQRRLSGELHDRIGQNLAALSVNLKILGDQIPGEQNPAIGARLKDSQTLLETTIATVRDLVTELRPTVLDDYGLLAGLRWYGEQVQARTGIEIRVGGTEPSPRLEPLVERGLFRIAQEALTNTVKHAHAQRADLQLRCNADRIVLTIADDGVGFAPPEGPDAREHWGQELMRERAEAVGARLRVDSAPGRGTQIEIEIPGLS